MSCFAFPEAGRPTLRARRSSASVDSGMLERSSLLSGIGLAFFASRLARADDADDFLAIFHLPGRVNDDQNPASDRSSQTLGANFSVRVLGIVPVERLGVTENGGSLLEGHAVLLQVAQGLPGVPREHIYVYTLIQRECKEEAAEVEMARTRLHDCILVRLAFGEGEGGFEHLGDAAVAGGGGAVMEDGEQLSAAVEGRHPLPACKRARIAGERQLENGREFAFGFHGGEQLFGDLLGAAEAGGRALHVGDQVGDPLASGVVELVEPAAEGAVFVEDSLKFRGDGGEAFFGVGLEAEVRGVAGGGVRAGLHALVDQQVVIALAGGEE